MLTLPKIAAIVSGSFLIAIAINFFLMPLKVLDGGLIGISLILNYLFKIKVGLVMLLLSIPIFVFIWRHNHKTIYTSVIGLLLSSYLIDLLEPYHYYFLYYIEWTPITRSILGGALIGLGLGIMLRFDCSTGGLDLLAHYISRFIPMNIGVMIFIMDGIIVSAGALLLPEDTFILSLLTIAAGGVTTGLCTLNMPDAAH
ncbi:YitT family protein [Paenibacillus mendelii]|uniref:YitT family protein n=1 Tax=Paenibacillus mendelii TaxID=206163 RepID=A0ABV6J5W6_9BACL|nr:YitT family protein [Paenibacillus mendelii]MCQ6560023.1 YitT family protein [Paenibacillus mendelii]